MNPNIYDENSYDENLKEQRNFDANMIGQRSPANGHEPHEFTKEELVALKEKIKNGIERIQGDMAWNEVVKEYVNGTDDLRQKILDILRESIKENNLPEEEYLKEVEYLEMRRKLETRSK